MAETTREPSDVEIRQAIATVIRGALVGLHGATLGNQVRIHDHWLWGFNLNQNASIVRITEGVEKGKIHGWLIGLNSVTRIRPEPRNTMEGGNRLRNMNPNRRDVLRTYRVWCYHQIDAGTSGNESNENSENRLAIEIEAVADALSMNPTLGIDNRKLLGHEEIQYSPIDVFTFGGDMANVAQGTLGVRLQKPLDLTQY